MKTSVLSGKLEQVNFLNKALMLLTVLLGVALVANGMFRQNIVLHVAPPVVQNEYWAAGTGGSEEYFRTMAATFITYVTNVNPQNVEYLHEQFLKYVDSSQSGPISVALGADSHDVTQQGMSRVFWPDKILVETEGLMTKVTIIGMEKWWLGGTRTKDQRRGYVLMMQVREHKPVIFGLSAGELGPDGQSMVASDED